uniref:Nicolin 1 n=1 Tax=Molossus molossus TaxID=27622 RepID=A0A7J8DBS0_MOLMO|nr:hypothetical protein HJG59_009390 [Molossus molossus]
MRAHRGPENWARISGGMRGARLSWAVAFLEMPWRDYCSFLPKGLGRQQLGSLLIGRLLGSELGPRWVLECVCQMLCDMARVLELRLILRQPSPLWLSFTVEELQIYQQGPKSPSMTFPKWLSHPVPCEQPAPLLEGLPDPSRVSSEVQQMWALTEMIRASHTSTRIGRFDVDGCYDLNLLSYT